MKSKTLPVLAGLIVAVFGCISIWRYVVIPVSASKAPQAADCKAGSTEQCPSDKFRADYLDWKAKHEDILKLMKSDGHVSELTRLDHEWKGMRDDLTQLAQQECPGCTFDDKTMKFTKPAPAPAPPAPAKK